MNKIVIACNLDNITDSNPNYENTDNIGVLVSRLQKAIRRGIERALKIEAKTYLPDKVKELAEKCGFKFNNLALKNIKSRWGSCSRKNNINLSIHLMRLPDHLINYVILHELVHTVHHNHSIRFWTMLNSLTGRAKSLNKELKKYRIAIY